MNNKLVKTLSVFLTVIILLSVAPVNLITFVSAGEAENEIEWTFDGETLVVTGKGELSSEYTTTAEWKALKNSCVNVRVEGNINTIGSYAFKDFLKLKKVEIGGDVAVLGDYAFHACPYLETVTITSPLQKIGDSGFADCTALKEIQLPETLVEIGNSAFINAVMLKNFKFPQNLITIGENAFKGSDCFDGEELVIPFSVEYIGLGAFADANVKSLTVPFIGQEVVDYGKYAGGEYTLGWIFGKDEFSNTESYEFNNETYYIPDTLKELKITKSVISGNLTLVPVVEKLVFASTIESEYLATNFAKDNYTLKEVYFEDGSAIKDINEGCFMFCENLTAIELPDDLTSIPDWAFHCCLSLETIDIPDTVTSISYQAFFACEKLSEIVLPQGLIYINSGAFECCSAIENIVIPSTVTRLGDRAFAECTNLKNVVVLLENLTELGLDIFKDTPYAGDSDSEKDDELNKESDFVISKSGELISYLGKVKNVIVPDGVTVISESAFKNRSDITSIKLPESLLKISSYSFRGCTGITELVVPDSIEEIDRNAFAGMCRLEKLTVPFIGKSKYLSGAVQTDDDNIKWWFEKTQEECSVCKGELCDSVDIPNRNYDVCKPKSFVSLTITQGNLANEIMKYALKDFGVKEVTLGQKVQGIKSYGLAEAGIEIINFHPDIRMSEIKSYAVYKNKIKSVTLPDGIEIIRDRAFASNEISELNLNEGLMYLGGFESNKLTSVKIPSTVKNIEHDAFFGNTLLEYVEIPEGVEAICLWAFGRTGIKEIVLPESITFISEGAFFKSKIERIVLPENLSHISKETFEDCEFLKEVVIGGSVEEISSSAFANCSGLETVVIPDSVTSISDDAFTNSTENLVIYCNEGSYAQQYAVQNNIKYTTLVLEAIPNQTYTGKAIEPGVKAKANNKQLTLDKEYEVSFADNIEAGVASVTAKGLGSFKHLVAKGKFTILPRQVKDVAVSYNDFAYYTPSGVKPKVSLFIGEDELIENVDYEIIGLDKVKNVGVYNIAISGKGNLSGTKNFTLEVLPRSITVTKIISTGDVKVTDSHYTLVEGVDYKLENRTDETGKTVTYVVGTGNYTDEKVLNSSSTSSGTSSGGSAILKLFELLRNLLAMIFGIFK